MKIFSSNQSNNIYRFLPTGVYTWKETWNLNLVDLGVFDMFAIKGRVSPKVTSIYLYFKCIYFQTIADILKYFWFEGRWCDIDGAMLKARSCVRLYNFQYSFHLNQVPTHLPPSIIIIMSQNSCLQILAQGYVGGSRHWWPWIFTANADLSQNSLLC